MQHFSLVTGLILTATAIAQQPLPDGGTESDWFRDARQITSVEMGLDKAGEAYFSPDGKRVCFQANPRGKDDYQIYVMNLDGAGLEMVSTGKGATTCSFFSPDGTKLIFASNHLDPRPVEGAPGSAAAASQSSSTQPASQATGASGRNYAWSFYPGMDIFEYTFATKQLKQLTNSPGYDAECSYSPDGKSIVFCSMRDGDQEIYIMDAEGKNPRRITNAKGYDGGPFFSPDGKRIVYRSDRKQDGNLQIFINTPDGKNEHAITGNDVLNWCPYWHPSGKWLIFTRADHNAKDGPPNYDLYLIRDDGSQLTRVTYDPKFDGLPVFSPDGKKLMWTSKRNGLKESQVFVADFVGLTPSGELVGPVRKTK